MLALPPRAAIPPHAVATATTSLATQVADLQRIGTGASVTLGGRRKQSATANYSIRRLDPHRHRARYLLTSMRTCVRVTSQGDPTPASNEPSPAATCCSSGPRPPSFPQAPPLNDVLRICVLLRDAEPAVYERAVVRWLGRFCLERPGRHWPTCSTPPKPLTGCRSNRRAACGCSTISWTGRLDRGRTVTVGPICEFNGLRVVLSAVAA